MSGFTVEDYTPRVVELTSLDRAYYAGDPQITDEEYDVYKQILIKYEEKHNKNNIKNKVGYKNTNDKFEHINLMYSLKDVFTISEYYKWNKPYLKHNKVISDKIDGVSLKIVYNKGKLLYGLTRGDGVHGRKIKKVNDLVKGLPTKISYLDYLEVTVEVFIKKDYLKVFNKKYNTTYKTHRSVCSAVVNILDTTKFMNELEYKVWGSILPAKTYTKQLMDLKDLGFNTINVKSVDDIDIHYKDAIRDRESLDYHVDGLVISIDALGVRNTIGNTIRYPRWSIALKLPYIEAVGTTITDIILNTSRYGVISPKAKVETVTINGIDVSYVNLYNFDYIKKNKLNVGSIVDIILSGDITPKILNVNKTMPVKRYNKCYSCGKDTTKVDSKLLCRNVKCKAVILAKVKYLTSKQCFNIKGLSETIIKDLLNGNIISNEYDIFKLDMKKLLKIGLTDIKGKTILDSLSPKNLPLTNILMALFVPDLSYRTCSLIVKNNGTDIFKYNIETILSNTKVNDIYVTDLVGAIKNNKSILQKLIKDYHA